jgi:DNA-binding XRE family transcriptional regulator
MPAGRPSDYDAAYCDKVIELGRTGASKAEMAAEIGCARSTFALWERAHEEFSEAVKLAVDLSQAWWEKNGRLATFGGTEGFNATSFIFNMKNRFPADWKDKVEQEQTGTLVHEIRRTIVRSGHTDS